MGERPTEERVVRPPRVRIEVVADRTSATRCDEGFLRVRRLLLRNHYQDGSASEEYRYDLVERDAVDAVVIVLVTADHRICLRSCLRPPLSFRTEYVVPLPVVDADSMQWEAPAGLIEPDERGPEGILSCAARETMEEVGLELTPSAFRALGPAVTLAPGVLAEHLHFVIAVVDPAKCGPPPSDGSPVEHGSQILFVSLAEALAATRDGRIADAKTEIAIGRALHFFSSEERGGAP